MSQPRLHVRLRSAHNILRHFSCHICTIFGPIKAPKRPSSWHAIERHFLNTWSWTSTKHVLETVDTGGHRKSTQRGNPECHRRGKSQKRFVFQNEKYFCLNFFTKLCLEFFLLPSDAPRSSSAVSGAPPFQI